MICDMLILICIIYLCIYGVYIYVGTCITYYMCIYIYMYMTYVDRVSGCNDFGHQNYSSYIDASEITVHGIVVTTFHEPTLDQWWFIRIYIYHISVKRSALLLLSSGHVEIPRCSPTRLGKHRSSVHEFHASTPRKWKAMVKASEIGLQYLSQFAKKLSNPESLSHQFQLSCKQKASNVFLGKSASQILESQDNRKDIHGCYAESHPNFTDSLLVNSTRTTSVRPLPAAAIKAVSLAWRPSSTKPSMRTPKRPKSCWTSSTSPAIAAETKRSWSAAAVVPSLPGEVTSSLLPGFPVASSGRMESDFL